MNIRTHKSRGWDRLLILAVAALVSVVAGKASATVTTVAWYRGGEADTGATGGGVVTPVMEDSSGNNLDIDLLVAVQVGRAQLLLRDSFDVPVASDDLPSELGARQKGQCAPTGYRELDGSASAGNIDGHTRVDGRLLIRSDTVLNSITYATPDHNFTELGALQIQVDITPRAATVLSGGASGHWAALTFGAPGPSPYPNAAHVTGVTVREGGVYELFDGGKLVKSGTLPAGAMNSNGSFTVRFVVDTGGAVFTNTAAATWRFFVGDGLIFSYTRSQGYASNYLTLSSYSTDTPNAGDVAAFDNLEVRGAADK